MHLAVKKKQTQGLLGLSSMTKKVTFSGKGRNLPHLMNLELKVAKKEKKSASCTRQIAVMRAPSWRAGKRLFASRSITRRPTRTSRSGSRLARVSCYAVACSAF